MIYGRHKGAMSWQEHLDSVLRSARFHSGIASKVTDTLLRA